jgi:hypothetical protein
VSSVRVFVHELAYSKCRFRRTFCQLDFYIGVPQPYESKKEKRDSLINCSDGLTIAACPLRHFELMSSRGGSSCLAGQRSASVPTNSGCPGGGDRTGVGRSAEGNDETAGDLAQVYFILSQLAGRSSEGYTTGQEYRRGVDDNLLCFISAKRRFIREKQSACIAASIVSTISKG